ncbi:lysophospholipid acyltransferase family protein [Micavibrio aeruginosavorus]|uniref:lysophospholipid acyltransferase family protein n=1 Tax=Micavibrio aeruginosavorus TaxID=349221 RepID=UPI003F4AEAC2
MKHLRYLIQFIAILPIMGFFAILPAATASRIGGWLGRKAGPHLGASKKAMRHIRMALPGRTDDEYDRIITGMWDNLGRTFAEYTHIKTLARQCAVVDAGKVLNMEGESNTAVMFSGHLGNWELQPPTMLTQFGYRADTIVRAPNNPYVGWFLKRLREMNGRIQTLPKSKQGTRQLVQTLKDGRVVGILIDQKYNEGIAMPFFGHPAMTSTAFVQLAQKFKCPLIPTRLERINETQCRLTIYDPLPVFDEAGNPRKVEDVIMDAHAMLERWITERPDQWIWLHRRWIDESRDATHVGTDTVN